MTIAIRNGDITTFKKCRQEWNFSSLHRQNLRLNRQPTYFGFGTAIHKGAEVWYNPTGPYDDAAGIEAFFKEWQKYIGDCYNPEEWADMRDMGFEMMRGYYDFAKLNDDFKPIRNEVEFEVPIIVPKGLGRSLPVGFSCNGDRHLFYKGEAVVYQGRIDFIGEDEFGLIFGDHKTASRFTDLSFLEMDEQLARYGYAMWILGLTVYKIYYNQFLKAVPSDPKVLTRVLKSGKVTTKLSVDKTQPTTAKRYELAVARLGLNMADYRDHIEYLRNNPIEFFRRTPIRKTPKEYQVIGERLFNEAVDMLNDPRIYPTPNTNWGCDKCLYREPCLALNEGNSPNFILKTKYHENIEGE